MPPDPFANDPFDPASAMDAIIAGDALSPDELAAIQEDIADLTVYEALLRYRGIRGLIVHCEECDEDHFHDWDILHANLRQLLTNNTMLPHEPAYEPNPSDYVTWDYCRGYVDAVMHLTEDETGLDN